MDDFYYCYSLLDDTVIVPN